VWKVYGQLTVASLNTQGVPIRASRLASRYAVIGRELDARDADVVCLQEVFTYWHLRLLAQRMASFRHVSYRPSLAGPAGGLVTFSRLPLSGTVYRGFGVPPSTPGISRRTRIRAGLKGLLVTRLASLGLCIVNTHPVANRDGDWSHTSRFYPLHRAQLACLTRAMQSVPGPAVICGDFNIDRDSALFGEFVERTGLADAFEGSCPATFHMEYLPPGEMPHCIDFILTMNGVKAEASTVVLTGKEALPGGPGYVSDHIGLCARLFLAAP
jgi:endonuclease/exonuclease/phosphatase family metal-dependent hydrolase